MLKNKGQNTLEYVILFAAVVLVFLVLMRKGGALSLKINQALDDTTSSMTTVSGRASTRP